MENLRENISKNIVKLRKANHMTQAELAAELNYSDKAVSKWERGESIPDIAIIFRIAGLFNVTVDMLLSDSELVYKRKIKTMQGKRIVITLLSVLTVWVIATFLFVILKCVASFNKVWLAFIYAVPVSAIVWLVFNGVWGKAAYTPFIVALLLWTTVLSVFLTVDFPKKEMLFYIAVPVQVVDILWFILIKINFREKYLNKYFKKNKK